MKTIPLTKGAHAIVDDEDYEWLNQWKWCYAAGYVVRSESRKGRPRNARRLIYMHRLILGAADGMVTDHVNLIRYDNRRCNLRLATPSQNKANTPRQATNTSGFKGVSWNKKAGCFHATIKPPGSKGKWLGLFKTAEEAGEAYRKAAIAIWGEFARV